MNRGAFDREKTAARSLGAIAAQRVVYALATGAAEPAALRAVLEEQLGRGPEAIDAFLHELGKALRRVPVMALEG